MGSYGGHVLPGTCFMIMARVKDLFGIIRSQRTARQTNLKSGRFSSENRFLDSNTDNVGKLLQKSGWKCIQKNRFDCYYVSSLVFNSVKWYGQLNKYSIQYVSERYPSRFEKYRGSDIRVIQELNSNVEPLIFLSIY